MHPLDALGNPVRRKILRHLRDSYNMRPESQIISMAR